MKATRTLIERKATTRSLSMLAAGGIVAIVVMAGTAMLVIGPDTADAGETLTETAQ